MLYFSLVFLGYQPTREVQFLRGSTELSKKRATTHVKYNGLKPNFKATLTPPFFGLNNFVEHAPVGSTHDVDLGLCLARIWALELRVCRTGSTGKVCELFRKWIEVFCEGGEENCQRSTCPLLTLKTWKVCTEQFGFLYCAFFCTDTFVSILYASFVLSSEFVFVLCAESLFLSFTLSWMNRKERSSQFQYTERHYLDQQSFQVMPQHNKYRKNGSVYTYAPLSSDLIWWSNLESARIYGGKGKTTPTRILNSDFTINYAVLDKFKKPNAEATAQYVGYLYQLYPH